MTFLVIFSSSLSSSDFTYDAEGWRQDKHTRAKVTREIPICTNETKQSRDCKVDKVYIIMRRNGYLCYRNIEM